MSGTILLADDSVTIQKVVELTFLDEDLRVVSVGNGSDALARLAELRPNLVLADVHMPGADGYEVCAAVQRTLPGVPVLLLVGTFEIFDAERAAAAGATGYMKKPFDSQELLRRVRELLASSPALLSPAASAPESAAFEPPVWERTQTVEESPVAEALEGESWSFEPVEELAPDAAETRTFADWSARVPTPESESEIVAPAAYSEPEPLFEPVTEVEEEPRVADRAPEPVDSALAVPGSIVELNEADVERIARRVVELLSEKAVRDVAWEVVPDLAELILKARIRELEASVE